MPEYLAPGVYVEEIEFGAKPIEGVSTSTAGFLGEAERGPTTPRLVTSWLDYQRVFGSYFGADKYLPYAVEGFFMNRGQRCYIGRIVKAGDDPAVTATSKLTAVGSDALTVEAIGEGSWGNRVAVKVSPGTSGGFKLSVFYWKKMPSTLYDPDMDIKTLPRPTETKVFDDISVKESPDYYEKKVNGISNLIKLSKKSGDSGVAPEVGHSGKAKAGAALAITLADDASKTNDAYNGMQITIIKGPGSGQTRKITDYEVDEDTKTKVATVDSNWGVILPDKNSEYRIFWPISALKDGFDSLAQGTAQGWSESTITLADGASDTKDAYKEMQITIVEGTGSSQTRKITDYDKDSKVATVDSNWETQPDATSVYRVFGPNPKLILADYQRTDTDEPGKRKGLTGFAEIDAISIVYSPNAQPVTGLVGALITHCETLKDRFAIIDAEQGSAAVSKLDPRSKTPTKYAAFYYPWIRVTDPEAGLRRLVPPGGHIAGIYARSDTERGVHKAPANEKVSGAAELEFQITKGEQDILNPIGVNVIRFFPGRGIRVWGARTLSSDTLWKYINVRRLFLFLEESIDEGTQWVVFEPNDKKLWARVKQTITQFLTRVWKDGALFGSTAEEAFFVKCDETTMTQDDIDNGRLIVLIGVAPVKPAEFVIFRIAQWAGGSAVTE
jgi:phage tail sheath protein FI